VPLYGHIEGRFPPRHRHEQLTGRFTNLSAFEHQACEGIVNIVRGEHNRSSSHPGRVAGIAMVSFGAINVRSSLVATFNGSGYLSLRTAIGRTARRHKTGGLEIPDDVPVSKTPAEGLM
jgi:hypothetical protein